MDMKNMLVRIVKDGKIAMSGFKTPRKDIIDAMKVTCEKYDAMFGGKHTVARYLKTTKGFKRI